MKRTNIWMSVLIIIAAVGVITALIYIGTSTSHKKNPDYPTDYESNFLTSCHKNGGSPNGCSCSLTYVEQNYTYEQARKLDGVTENLPQDLQKAFQDCQNK